MHEQYVVQYLNRLHEIILNTQLVPKKIESSPLKEPIIDLKNIYPEVNLIIEEG